MTSVIQYQARKATVASINAQSRSIGGTSAYSFPGFAKIVHKLRCHSVVPSVSGKMGRPIVSRENACFEGNNLAYVSLRRCVTRVSINVVANTSFSNEFKGLIRCNRVDARIERVKRR